MGINLFVLNSWVEELPGQTEMMERKKQDDESNQSVYATVAFTATDGQTDGNSWTHMLYGCTVSWEGLEL